MKITVHLFAAARDAVGDARVDLELSDKSTVADLRLELVRHACELQPLQNSLLVAVNSEYATDDQILNLHDEVACFPPVSGG